MGISRRDVIDSIDLLAGSDEIDWSSASYESVDADGRVRLEGRTAGGDLIDVVMRIESVTVRPDFDDDYVDPYWDEYWDED